jgi:hypothetical protein
VRRIVPLLVLSALVVPATAAALLTPGRTVTNTSTVSALSVTHRSVVYAVGRSSADCGHVRLWDTATRGLWTFGSRTIRGCEEGPSGGFGISQVSTSGRRVLWVTHIGGNFTDYQLWTATPTRTAPRRLAFASVESGDPPAIVLGVGTQEGVPYAVGSTVTYVSDSGARLFRTTLDSPVRLLAAGPSFGDARVVAALANGEVVVLSKSGARLRTDEYDAGAVRAIQLAYGGPVVQAGDTVNLGPLTGGTKSTLPPGALMLDYRQRAILYRRAMQVRKRHVGTGADTLVRVIAVRPSQPMHFSVDWGSAWAQGASVNWRSGPPI